VLVTRIRTGLAQSLLRLAGVTFSIYTASRPALLLTKPPIQWVPGASSPRVKRPEPETDHSLLSSAEVMNDGDISPQTFSWRDA
jgi:hypothetical protein